MSGPSEQAVEVLSRHDPVWVWTGSDYRIECGCNEAGLLPSFATREEWAPHVLADLLPLLTPASPENAPCGMDMESYATGYNAGYADGQAHARWDIEQDDDTFITSVQVGRCTLPPDGWWCSLPDGHDGPCPTRRYPDAALARAAARRGGETDG